MKKIVYITLVSLVFAACERIVEVDIPGEEPRVVVESQISTKLEPWKVRLTLSQHYFNQDPAETINTASVVISSTDGSIVTLNHTDTGMFVSDAPQQCMAGESYTLTINYDGQEYIASESVANAFPIDTIASYFLPNDNGFIEAGYYVFIQGKENDYKGDSYEFKFYKNDTLLEDFGSLIEDDEFGQISYLNQTLDRSDPLAGLAQGIIPRPFPFNVEPGDTVRVEQCAISPQYYQFIIDYEAQLNIGGTPFDPPPANPNNNISNGGLGYFSVIHFEEASLVVEE